MAYEVRLYDNEGGDVGVLSIIPRVAVQLRVRGKDNIRSAIELARRVRPEEAEVRLVTARHNTSVLNVSSGSVEVIDDRFLQAIGLSDFQRAIASFIPHVPKPSNEDSNLPEIKHA